MDTTVLLRRLLWAAVVIAVGAVALMVVVRSDSAPAPPATATPVATGGSIQSPGSQPAVSPLEWPTYLHASLRTGYTPDRGITASNAFALAKRQGWPVDLGGAIISTQPVVADGVVYSGSWDGNEYAICATTCVTSVNGKSTTHASGAILWKTALGKTTPGNPAACGGAIGVVSTPATATLTIGGDKQPTAVLFLGAGGNDSVGGGSGMLVALDAHTGAVRWKTMLGPAPATLIYSSPLVYTPAGAAHASVYVGVSSYADCPLVLGRLVQIDAANGTVQHEFDVVPPSCLGGGVWGSPTVDPADGSIYFATGNALPCAAAPLYNEALVKLRSTDLGLIGAWQVPHKESTSNDNDFGSVPTLFTGTVTPGAARRALVGIGSKNGYFYVFDRSNIGAGPLVRLRVSVGGACGDCGQGIIAPAAYDGTRLFVAGGPPPGHPDQKGVIDAFDPNSLGVPLWVHATDGIMLSAVTAAPGIIVVGGGNNTLVMSSRNGLTLAILPASGGIYGAPSIAHGVLYEGDTHGRLFAYSVNGA